MPLASAGIIHAGTPTYQLLQRKIHVNGNLADWAGIKPNVVADAHHLWFGQGMVRKNWKGTADLSYQWRGAYFGNKLYFLFEVNDDKVIEGGQAFSYLCDCIEIYLDYGNCGGPRVKIMDGRKDWLAKCDPRELMGYEMHFLPTNPPRVYLDHRDKYAEDKPQTGEYRKRWKGEVVTKRTATGYIMEMGFSPPHLTLTPGMTVGIETGVCDNDGRGRKSIMIWTGTKKDFWLTMDDYGKVTLERPGAR